MRGSANVIRGDALDLPLEDGSVDLCVTSPPYWSLRSYQDAGVHYNGQVGSEPTAEEFIGNLLAATREMMRVCKPTGSIFVNLGDKYSGRSGGPQGVTGGRADRAQAATYGERRAEAQPGAPAKSLMLLPQRYAIRCVDELGLILRAEIVWSKPNGLPESVTDRVRRSHEVWWHFTLSPRYFSAVDEIREEHLVGMATGAATRLTAAESPYRGAQTMGSNGHNLGLNPLGKLPGSVWTVPTEPLRVPDHLGVDHFAAFPTEWPKRIIQGWSPAGVCVECREGRRPVVAKGATGPTAVRSSDGYEFQFHKDMLGGLNKRLAYETGVTATITGYACACPEPTADTTRAVILDPFGGTGTTALVAKALGRDGITVDMSADYCRLAEWRTNDRDQLAKVLGVAKAEQQPADQLSIFDTEETA